jgi:DNA-binding protein HU-beta
MATKSEMIDAVADAAGMSKADTEKTLGAFFDHVVAEAKKGEAVAWPGFGKFSTTERSARTGRNPQTGEPVQIKASTAVKFTSSQALKTALNGPKK